MLNKKGAISYYVIGAILLIGTLSISSMQIYMQNTILSMNVKKQISVENLELYQVKNEIAEKIMYNDTTNFSVRDISVRVNKLTNNTLIKSDKNIRQNANNVKVFLSKDKLETKISAINNYLIFSLSPNGYSIGYSEEENAYDIGYKDDKFYFAIEESENKVLYIDTNDKNEIYPLFIVSYNEKDTNFYVAEFKYGNQTHYVLYQEDSKNITELIDSTK